MIENLSETSALIAALAQDGEVPTSGTVAAAVTSMAASLLALVSDRSRGEWAEAAGAVAQAQALGRRALLLGQQLALTYGSARAALARGTGAAGDVQQRDWRLAQAVSAAAEPPLALAGCAADVAQLAVAVAARGEAALQADAVVAAKLAAAAADSAAYLVAINLVAGADEARVSLARRRAQAAAHAACSAATKI